MILNCIPVYVLETQEDKLIDNSAVQTRDRLACREGFCFNFQYYQVKMEHTLL